MTVGVGEKGRVNKEGGRRNKENEGEGEDMDEDEGESESAFVHRIRNQWAAASVVAIQVAGSAGMQAV